MGRFRPILVLTIAAFAAVTAWPATASAERVCWPGIAIPAIEFPAITIPAKEVVPANEISIPTTSQTITIPAVTIPAVTVPAIKIPALTIPERCYETDKTDVPPPSETTVRTGSYHQIDESFSLSLSVAYWRQAGGSSMVPNHAAKGFAKATAKGRLRNQYVRPYFRVDRTFVPGFWRYAPKGGTPTCSIIHCTAKRAR